MKIKARNSYNYIQHIKTLTYLSGKYLAEDVKNMAYSVEGEEIYLQLRRLEARANKLQVMECNGDAPANIEQQENKIKAKVAELLPRLNDFFINGDPRGYTLKAKETAVTRLRSLDLSTYTDWGGYFILAPEF
jgi:hypothetical protein